jgi:hypothetical protein
VTGFGLDAYGTYVPRLFYVRNMFFSGSRTGLIFNPWWLYLISIGGLL